MIAITAVTVTSATASVFTTSAAAATTTASWSFFTRTSFVYGESSSIEIFSMELFNRLFGIIIRGHFDEGKSTASTGEFVHDQVYIVHSASLGKVLLQGCICRLEGQISDIEASSHSFLLVQFLSITNVPDRRRWDVASW